MKRPLCTICLLIAAAAALRFFSLREPGQPVLQEAGTDRSVQGVFPVTLQETAARGERVRILGQVLECRQYEDQTVLRLHVKDIAVSGMENGADPPGDSSGENCICYIEKTTLPQVGSIVCVEGDADGFSKARNPGEFDYACYYWAQGVTCRLRNAVLISVSRSRTPLRAALMRARAYASDVFLRYLEIREAGVMSAMLTGDKTGLSDEVRSLYAQSGIAHILAISGLHISLIGAMLERLLGRVGAPRAAVMAVCCVFLSCYAVMTGLSASAVRASVMFVIGLNAGCVRRTYDMKTAVSVSMAVQLMIDPRLAGDAGFQLSYSAVFGIAWLTPALLKLFAACLPRKSRGLPGPVKAFAACLAVSLATLPFLLIHQYEYAVYGLLWNPVALPGVAVLLFAGALLLGFGALSDVCAACVHSASPGLCGLFHAAAEGMAHAAAFFCRVILLFYEQGSRFVRSLPGSLLRGRPGTVRVVIYAGMLLGLIVYAEWRGKKRTGKGRGACRTARFQGISGIGWLMLALLVLLVPVRTGITITMLDVGQGDGICLEQTPGHAVLIDCGSSDQRNLFEHRLMPFLKYRGIYEVDAVFLSHLDTDHVSAVYDLLEEMRTEKIEVGCIVTGQEIPHDGAYERLLAAAGEACVPVYAMRAGDVYEQGACRLTCLGPSEESGEEGDRNARSLILRLDYGSFQALFMGDADASAELAAVRVMDACMRPETIELLKAAHHGSRNSTSARFLAQVRPRIAVISAGEDNSYGHPHEETLTRLKEKGCDVYQTPECGAVTIHVSGSGIRVETFLAAEGGG